MRCLRVWTSTWMLGSLKDKHLGSPCGSCISRLEGLELQLERFKVRRLKAFRCRTKQVCSILVMRHTVQFCPMLVSSKDKFNLSTEERFAGRLPPCSGDATSLPHRTSLGKAFLQSLEQKSWQGARQLKMKLSADIRYR